MTSDSLRANVIWAFAGNGGYALCQWGILIAIAKLGSATDVGSFALALALTGPPMMFANLHLRAVQATDAADVFPFGNYLGLRLLTSALALMLIAGLALATQGRGERLALVGLVGAAKAIESICDVLYGRLQRDERQRRIAMSMLVRGMVSVAAVGGTLASGGTVVDAIAMMAAGWLGCLLVIDLPSVRATTSLRPVFTRAALAPLAWTALPMGCVMALGSLTTNLPRYALEAASGTQALGHFAAIAYLFVATMQPMLAVGAAVSPRLARLYQCDVIAYQQLVRRTVQIAIVLGLLVISGVLTGGARLLSAVYTPDYAVHIRAFEWAAVATGLGFVASALGYAATAARRFHAQLLTAVIALCTCAIASALLVPSHGLVGAAWAIGCTEAVRTLCGLVIYTDTVARRAPHPAPSLIAEVARVG